MLLTVTITLIIAVALIWTFLKSKGQFNCHVMFVKGLCLGLIYEDDQEEDGSTTYFIQVIIWIVTITFIWNVSNEEKEEEDEL